MLKMKYVHKVYKFIYVFFNYYYFVKNFIVQLTSLNVYNKDMQNSNLSNLIIELSKFIIMILYMYGNLLMRLVIK
jgi:hypothetical protein